MKSIPLTKGFTAVVDDADYAYACQFKWHAVVQDCTVYAARTNAECNRKIYLHRDLLGIDNPDAQVDHADGNGLNNCRSNLRPCSSSQNSRNRRKVSDLHTSFFKGVSWHKENQKWQARIYQARREKYLGCFDDEVEAAQAYDKAAYTIFGEFAKLNFPKSPSMVTV